MPPAQGDHKHHLKVHRWSKSNGSWLPTSHGSKKGSVIPLETNTFRIVTWNVDGASPWAAERLEGILKYLEGDILYLPDPMKGPPPSVISFQNMHARCFEVLRGSRWVRRYFFMAPVSSNHWPDFTHYPYGTVTLVSRLLPVSGAFSVSFDDSCRDALFVDCHFTLSSEANHKERSRWYKTRDSGAEDNGKKEKPLVRAPDSEDDESGNDDHPTERAHAAKEKAAATKGHKKPPTKVILHLRVGNTHLDDPTHEDDSESEFEEDEVKRMTPYQNRWGRPLPPVYHPMYMYAPDIVDDEPVIPPSPPPSSDPDHGRRNRFERIKARFESSSGTHSDSEDSSEEDPLVRDAHRRGEQLLKASKALTGGDVSLGLLAGSLNAWLPSDDVFPGKMGLLDAWRPQTIGKGGGKPPTGATWGLHRRAGDRKMHREQMRVDKVLHTPIEGVCITSPLRLGYDHRTKKNRQLLSEHLGLVADLKVDT